MKKIFTLDDYSEINKIKKTEALEKALLGNVRVLLHLGSQDNLEITTSAYYPLSRSSIVEVKNLLSGGELQDYSFHICHLLFSQAGGDGNNYFMSLDLVTDYYMHTKSYVTELPVSITQEVELDSSSQLGSSVYDEISSIGNTDGSLGREKDDKNELYVSDCPVIFSHEIIVDKLSGKESIKLNDPAIDYIKERVSMLPRFCRVIQSEINIDANKIKQMYNMVSIAFYLRHFNDSKRTYRLKDVKFTITKQAIKTNKIYIMTDGDDALLPYFDPSQEAFYKNEREMVLSQLKRDLSGDKYPKKLHASKVEKSLRDQGYDYTKDDKVAKHFAYVTADPNNSRVLPMKKIKK